MVIMPETLHICYGIDGSGPFWAVNTESEPLILETIQVQSYFDVKYNISHEVEPVTFNDY